MYRLNVCKFIVGIDDSKVRRYSMRQPMLTSVNNR